MSGALCIVAIVWPVSKLSFFFCHLFGVDIFEVDCDLTSGLRGFVYRAAGGFLDFLSFLMRPAEIV